MPIGIRGQCVLKVLQRYVGLNILYIHQEITTLQTCPLVKCITAGGGEIIMNRYHPSPLGNNSAQCIDVSIIWIAYLGGMSSASSGLGMPLAHAPSR